MPNFGEGIDARSISGLAREAEEAGWDGFFLWDHPFLILYLGVKDERDEARMAELDARVKATHAALERLDGISDDESIPDRSRERLRQIYGERIRRYESGLEARRVTEEYRESSDAWIRWRRELFDAERKTVVTLRDEGEINADVIRRVERDIDLEELRESG